MTPHPSVPGSLGAPAPVLVVGDANVDLILRGDVIPRFGQAEQLAKSGELVLGGSASIVAAGLARLAVPTTIVARVGDDAFGSFTLDALRGHGVHVDAVEVDPVVPTGLSVILSTPDDRAILTVLGTIPTLTPDRVRAVARGVPAGDVRGHVHVASYFLQPGLARGLASLLADLRADGLTTSLDTNWDPAQVWAGLDEVLAHVDVLLPNTAELRAIAGALGGPSEDDDACGSFLASRGPRVVVKDGARGGWSIGPDGVCADAPGLSVDVVDTTGAGDSFDAGYLAACAYGVSDEVTRLRWATAAGSLSTLGTGGTGRQATLDELAQAGVW
ncbi:Sugar or nucleoside kinase, ribokinase family [Sanguibacter gelidistatuariae]|uniref:Sugar or nucleoside kinase, ribokinase family n=1 Tax=Sanguibacter gelidistatuariae TaxID=1814289 RepID=A0A1G6H8L6_9MICO|nr:carbohydrate kinase family protein [Sanguibacter gelidistatuariae]SDB90602.1 Sugar or nucleoside kinase, ribokinase family [Sanguibacter gelidistatuariae]